MKLPESNKLIQISGLFVQNDDLHFINLKDELPHYQSKVRNAAYKYVRNWRVAIDVGGHIGIFTVDFARKFNNVHTFEPMPFNRICLEKNAPSNVTIYPYGLGNIEGFSEMRFNSKNSGGSEVINPGNILNIQKNELYRSKNIIASFKRLDDLDIKNVDLIKIDVQGMEEMVLIGASRTFRDSRPVVIIEEKIVKSRPNDTIAIERARNVILSYGYKLAEIVGNDAIYLPSEHSHFKI